MKLSKMIHVLKTVQLLNLVGNKPTRHAVACESHKSRATIYRYCKTMQAIGLIEVNNDKPINITQKGYELIDAYKELPL